MNTSFVVVFCVFLIGLVCAGVAIKSPDTVHGEVRITGKTPPQIIRARTSGKLIMLQDSLPKYCYTGSYIAYIDNPADARDIERLKLFLASSSPTEIQEEIFYDFQNCALGELYHSYYSLVSSIIAYKDLQDGNNQYEQKINSLKSRILKDSITLNNYRGRLSKDSVLLGIKQKDFLVDSTLYSQNATLESNLNHSLAELLSTQKEVMSLNNTIDYHIQDIQECSVELRGIEYHYSFASKKALSTLYHSYNELISDILDWENRYVLKADADGTVEMANLISDNSFISAEEPAFTLLVDDNDYYGVALLPPSGAGMVARGQKVHIKIAAYPFEEYGILHGEVSDISMNTTHDGGYIVYIHLPNGMTSTNGSVFSFAKAMIGEAEIITKEKRLIERVFNQMYRIIADE